MTWADNVNGIYEMGGALALAYNCWTTYKDKEIKGLSLLSMTFFTSWGYWNLYYYPSLHQWMSTVGAASLVFFNTIWLGQAIYYTRLKRIKDMVEEFEKHFPGKCVICSYHRWGYQNGMTDEPNPPAHDNCLERTKNV